MLAGGVLFVVGLIALLIDHAVLGASLLLAGALLLCVRRRVALDRRQRLAASGWSLAVFLTRTEHRLSASHQVVVSREERQFGDTEYEVFPVTLEGPGSDAIRLREPRNHESARRLAEETAKFLALGMRDRSSGETVERAPGTLDHSLRQRAKQSGVRARMPQRPAAARSSASFAGATATIDIPPYLHWIWPLVVPVLVAALGAALIEIDTKRREPPTLEHLAFVFLALLPAILGFFVFFMHGMGVISRDRLTVSPTEVTLTRRSLLGKRTTRMPADEIEEVVSVPVGGFARRVVIRADRVSLKLATVRADEEARWLKDLLVHVLTAS